MFLAKQNTVEWTQTSVVFLKASDRPKGLVDQIYSGFFVWPFPITGSQCSRMMFIHLDLSIIWHPYSPSDPDMSLVPSSCFLSSNSSSMLPDWGNLILAKRCLKDSKKTDKVVQHFFPINNPSLAICNKNTVYVYIHNIVIIKVYTYIYI